MNFKLSKEAENDLENIWLYTFENWSPSQADRYIDLIIDEIEYLSENPDSGKSFESVRKGYFRSKVKSHLIFYKIDSRAEKLEIIRILHERMDFEHHL